MDTLTNSIYGKAIREIETSITNGQSSQAREQIAKYGKKAFIIDYANYVKINSLDDGQALHDLTKAINLTFDK